MRRKRNTGSAIAELGPSLFLILVCMLFPLIDLLYLGAGWGMVWVLHRAEVRECAIHRPQDWNIAMEKANTEFANSAFSKFIKIQRAPIAQERPVFTPSEDNASQVLVTTRASIKPFIYLPFAFLMSIPGLTAPMDVSFSSTRPQEEKGRD